MNEDHVAFHDVVMLLGWREASNSGPKVRLGLSNREALGHFDTATRRKGKKAGQRYHASLMSIIENEPLGTFDMLFAGANWAHQDGARVVFNVEKSNLVIFELMKSKDQGAEPTCFWLTLVQVDDDETAIDQVKAAKLDGGPRSKQVAMMCKESEFQLYVSEVEDRNDKSSFEEADAYVKRICGIDSKVLFDHSEGAWELFTTQVRRPYFEWAGNAS